MKQDEEFRKIFKTTDYSKFNFIKENRNIDQIKVQRFTVVMQEAPYLMSLNPILVDHHFNIYDGQHRFEACKKMNFPVFYVQEKLLKSKDIIILNKDQKNWELQDYINYYIAIDNKNFINLNNFCNKNGCSVSIALLYLGYNRKNIVTSIKEGSLIWPRQEIVDKAQSVAENYKKFISKIDSSDKFKFGYSFCEAVSKLHLENKIEIKSFFEKIIELKNEIYPIRGMLKYFDMFRSLGLM